MLFQIKNLGEILIHETRSEPTTKPAIEPTKHKKSKLKIQKSICMKL